MMNEYLKILYVNYFKGDNYYIFFFCVSYYSTVHVEDCMDWRDPSFIEALEVETTILQKRVEACKSHVILVTCFDSYPRLLRHNNTSQEVKIS